MSSLYPFGYRNSDIATRQKFVNLVNSVKDSGGSVHVFSSMHVSGERKFYYFHYSLLFWGMSGVRDIIYPRNSLTGNGEQLLKKKVEVIRLRYIN